jgi:hypothetical protein
LAYLSIAENMLHNSKKYPAVEQERLLKGGVKFLKVLQAFYFVGGFVCLGFFFLALLRGIDAMPQRLGAALFVVFMAAQMLGYTQRDINYLEEEIRHIKES